MQINKIIPAKAKAIPIITTLATGTGMVCNAQAQNNIQNNQFENITVNDSTQKSDKKANPVSFDVAARTFQFMDGSNMSCVSTGVGKNWDNLAAYFTVMGGYNFANKLPSFLTMGYLDYRYPKQNDKANLSAELYHESALNKDGFVQKFAATPIKFNSLINDKIYAGIDPRLAVNVVSGQVIPKVEVLATVSGQIYKSLSGYIIGQIYDIAHPKNPSNYSINVGLIKKIHLPRNKSFCKLH